MASDGAGVEEARLHQERANVESCQQGDKHEQLVHVHDSPSSSDLLSLKRQRVKSVQSLSPACPEPAEGEAEQQEESSLTGSRQHDGELQGLAADVVGLQEPASVPAGDGGKDHAQQSSKGEDAELDLEPGFAEAFLPAVFGESMSAYFQRLRAAASLDTAATATTIAGGGCSGVSCTFAKTLSLEQDGVYLHKRPIRAPNGSSPLAVCGSVLHHVVVYVKQGPLLHTLDYGPANGADVTANILEEAPPKRVLATSTLAAGSAATADGAATEELPYMYLGPAARGLEHPLVQKLLAFAESRPYHAIRNNCIHFADALVRLLSAGAVRGAPLLYDAYCGAVPAVDNPMLMMMQFMLRMPWFVVVDGSPLAAAFADAWRSERAATAAGASTQAAAADREEDLENNCGEAVVAEAAAVQVAAAVAADAEMAGGEGRERAAGLASGHGEGGARACEGAETGPQQQQQQQPQQQQPGTAGREEERGAEASGEQEERREEEANDHIAEVAEATGPAGADVEMATVTAAGAAVSVATTAAPGEPTCGVDVVMAEAAVGAAGGEVESATAVVGAAECLSVGAGARPQPAARLPSLPPRKARK